MANGQQHARPSAAWRRLLPLGVICLVLGLAAVVIVFGRGGCAGKLPWAEKDEDELKKKLAEERAKKKKKPPPPPFEVGPLVTRPAGSRLAASWYKPGHWTEVTLEQVKANDAEFFGELQLAVTDGQREPIPVEATRFDMTSTRDVILAKREPKPLGSVLFVPPTEPAIRVSCRLHARKRGRAVFEGPGRLARMPSYQYHLVVLSRRPEGYAYLRGLPSVNPPSDTWSNEIADPYYRVALMRADQPAALPSHTSAWTSIACVLWDEADPDALDADQRQALLDWLHWGGQLIVSGPGTLDTPPAFLAPYLPATSAGNRELETPDIEALNQWANQNKRGESVRLFNPSRAMAGVQLRKRPQARVLLESDSGALMVERRVGRGRVVVTAFRLSSGQLTAWPAFDELFNAFLLRHPPRKFKRTLYPAMGGAVPLAEDADATLHVGWADGHQRLDAARISELRYFTRDTGVGINEAVHDGAHISGYGPDVSRRSDVDITLAPQPGPGLAAWTDFNPVANSARQALIDAARIKIPKRSFVFWVVAWYLVVLVPTNWVVFRLLGRVEWAWAAAPGIAIACTVVVVHAAELEIGFARSRTEIAIVELQPECHRAHMTRYTVLYTSLTTRYNFHFEDPGAVAQPFAEVAHPDRFREHDRRGLFYRRGQGASLLDYHVRSNDTGMVHSEQMLDLGGALSLTNTSSGGFQIENQTELSLHGAGIIMKDASGRIRTAWVGLLRPGSKVLLSFSLPSIAPPDARLWEDRRIGSALGGTGLAEGQLNLRKLVELAQDVSRLLPGEARLVAEVELEEPLPGMVIDPGAPQSEQAALVVAHLKYGPGEDPEPDVNTRENPELERAVASDSL